MNFFEPNKKDDPNDIYFYRPNLPHIETKKHFEIMEEQGKLRVKNKNINCLFSNLTFESFDMIYNDFNQHLNLNFEPVEIDFKIFELKPNEKEKLFEIIVTSWIYYYTINNMTVQVIRADFIHPFMVDYVLRILDKKYGEDTRHALIMGAKILRQEVEIYTKTVERRRQYYDR